MPGLHVSTWTLSSVGCENDVMLMRVWMSDCTYCLGNHQHIMTFKGYEINGNTYYGHIEEI
jgi:hypothetical protein